MKKPDKNRQDEDEKMAIIALINKINQQEKLDKESKAVAKKRKAP